MRPKLPLPVIILLIGLPTGFGSFAGALAEAPPMLPTNHPPQLPAPFPSPSALGPFGSSIPTSTLPREVLESAASPGENPLAPDQLLVFALQRYLDNRGISPGPLDGVPGPQTKTAWKVYLATRAPGGQASEGSPAQVSSPASLFRTYAVTSADIERVQPLGKSWLEKSQQSRLDFETVLECVAETFHSSQHFVRLLNPGLDWSSLAPGAVVTVPRLIPPAVSAKASVVRISIAEKVLQAFDARSNLLVHFPCSIAQRIEKRPLGELEIVALADHPNYLFNPDNFPESAEARELGRKFILPPGPNNPVGTVWMGLNRAGYGIHGTPRPEEVGRTESHGCFRLANWNAELLLKLVHLGTRVVVVP